MRRGIVQCLGLSILLSAAAAGQTRPEFEVASIRPSSEQTTQVSLGLRISGSQVRISYMSLKDYVAMAYRVRPDQVVGPDWMSQRFDIAAKIPDGAPAGQVAEMLQTLLADRFQLKIHRDSKDFPVYALVVARTGLKLEPPAVDSAVAADRPAGTTVSASGSAAGVGVDLGGGSSFSLANNRLEIRKMTMGSLADVATRFVDRPVLDLTELTGAYDMTLELTPEDYLAMMIRSAVNAGVALPPQALRALDNASLDPLSNPLKKFGLAFESRRAPLDVIIVDSMQKMPTEN